MKEKSKFRWNIKPVDRVNYFSIVDLWNRGIALSGMMPIQMQPKRRTIWKDLFNQLPLDRFNRTLIKLKTGQAEGNKLWHLFDKSDNIVLKFLNETRVTWAVIFVIVQNESFEARRTFANGFQEGQHFGLDFGHIVNVIFYLKPVEKSDL